ncbi:MAG: hypothetical protein MJY99_11705 [Fibrobacter sp.]|nr:hypothetical protein [Fibrobacter sp.]
MKKILLTTILTACAMLGLWACGEGSLEHATDDDALNVEKIGGLSKKEIKEIIELCQEDKVCLAEYEAALVEIPPDYSSASVCDEDSEDCDAESSSSECAEGEEGCAPESSSSVCAEDDEACGVESSSSSDACDEDDDDCDTESSSSSEPESSSSSSEDCAEDDGDCGAESSSSSEPESSSSEEPVSSSSSEPLKVKGKCVASVESADPETFIEWTYVPDDSSLTEGLEYEWFAEGGQNETNGKEDIETIPPSVKFKFDESLSGETVSAELTIYSEKSVDKFECASVKINVLPSSSEGGSSSSAQLPVKGSCRPEKSSAYTFEEITWTYIPAEGSRTEGLEFEWSDVDASEGGFGQTEISATFSYARVPGVGKAIPDLTVSGVEITCEPVALTDRPVIKGTCTANPEGGIELSDETTSGTVVWTFEPTGSVTSDMELVWGLGDGATGYTQDGNSATMTFARKTVNDKYVTYYSSPTLTVKHATGVAADYIANCDQVRIYDKATENQGGDDPGGDDPDDETVECNVKGSTMYLTKSACTAMGGTY